MPSRLVRSALLTVAALALGCAPALADSAPAGDVHIAFPSFGPLPSSAGMPNAQAAVVGDVDGDGLADSAVAVPVDEAGTARVAVWVNLAPATIPSSVQAGGPGWRGFRIDGAAAVDDLAGLPDVNGDGLGEVAVADGATVDVVYGRTDGATVDVRSLGGAGFTIAGLSGGRGGAGSSGPIGARAIGHELVAAGDQDGDGRPDLAVTTATGVAVVRTPATAGAAVDADDPADDVFRLTASGTSRFVGDLGDLDGDGRKDLMVAWHGSDGAAHVAGAVSPAPGADVDLPTVADGGHGFRVDLPGHAIGTAVTVGDQNGDGRRDVYLSLRDSGPRGATPIPSPALGTVATFAGPSYDQFFGQLEPAGDQDGDGVEDVGDYRGLVLSSFARAHPEAQMYPAGNVMIVGAVPDRNGDGRAERLGLHADPYSAGFSGAIVQATYQLETYVTPLSLPSPGSYNPLYLCCPPAPGSPAAPPAPALKPIVKPAVKHLFVGTRKADKLTGTAGADTLRGLGGRDVLRGLGGDDKLDGGSGRDVIDGGAGNDVISARDGEVDTIRCGAGRNDRATVDRNDKVSGCEKVSRTKKKAKQRRR